MQEGQPSLIAALRQGAWPQDAAVDLARSAHIVAYERRAAIFHAGESADLLYVLLSGEVKLLFQAPGGASVLVSIARAGRPLGVFAPDAGRGQNGQSQLFTAQALSRCKVAIISATRVARTLQQLTMSQLVAVLDRAREEWVDLSCRLLAFMTMSVRRRLAHTLTEIATDFGIADSRGKLIAVRLSHEDFASLVGASRPMVSKHLKQLTDSGVLAKAQGRYVLLAAPPSKTEQAAGAAHCAPGNGTQELHNVVRLDSVGVDTARDHGSRRRSAKRKAAKQPSRRRAAEPEVAVLGDVKEQR